MRNTFIKTNKVFVINRNNYVSFKTVYSYTIIKSYNNEGCILVLDSW